MRTSAGRRGSGPRPPGERRRAAGLLLAIALPLLVTACARPRVALPPPAPSGLPGWEETGSASWYGHPYHGRRTASGEVYDMSQMTAAHRTLPFGTWLLVENLSNARTAEVRVNDRGPFVDGRILDLSYGAARLLGVVGPGVVPVRLRVIAPPGAGAGPPGARFTVQVGAFADEARARSLERELARAGARASVQRAEVGGRLLYRVRVGGFASRDAAEQEAERLARAGYPALIVEP